MNNCLCQELIERYIAGLCSSDEKKNVEIHLAQCNDCRKHIESIQSELSTHRISNNTNFHEDITKTVIEKTQAFNDEINPSYNDFQTKPLPAVTSLPFDGDSFARLLGSMIEGYEILEEMPRGGQAVVYKAIHTATKTKVAIKVLLPTLLGSARARYYFEREAELIASLDHPNIVGIRDSGIIHHQYFFVMQYIEGQTLDKYILSAKLSFREQVLLFNKICAAISYAHQQGIIHRDLKFANILVDERGEPHVLDFGLAKAIGLSEQNKEEAVVTKTGQLAGSLSTMSPEQAAGRPDLIDVRTDVYSLGVILYRMLTGQYPYEVFGSTLEVLQNIQKVDPVRPKQIIRKFDSDVEAIVLTTLEKTPEKRYHSAADLHSDICNWLEGRPIRVRSISTVYLVRKIIARHRYTSAVAVLLLLIIIGFAYVSFDLLMSTMKAKQETESYASMLSTQVTRNDQLARLFALNYFIEAWKQDNVRQALFVLSFMSQDSREFKAAMFLSDSKPVIEKEADFRRGFSAEQNWFVEFIIGENHLKNGNRQDAYEAFKRSYESAQQLNRETVGVDGLLIGQVVARLEEFDTAEGIALEDEIVESEN